MKLDVVNMLVVVEGLFLDDAESSCRRWHSLEVQTKFARGISARDREHVTKLNVLASHSPLNFCHLLIISVSFVLQITTNQINQSATELLSFTAEHSPAACLVFEHLIKLVLNSATCAQQETKAQETTKALCYIINFKNYINHKIAF
jgi:hypothetical protein